MNETANAATARVYVTADLSVFPLWWVESGRCACPNGRLPEADKNYCGARSDGTVSGSPGKHPITRSGVKDASRALDTIATWWTRWPLASIGMPAGDNGLAILDVDPSKGGEESFTRLSRYAMTKGINLRATLTANTGGGGRHHVFAQPEGGIKSGSNVFGSDMPGLDSRGRGGYIVAWPSVHVSGGRYEWIDFAADVAPWPAILTKLMEPVRPPVPAQRAPLGTCRAEISDAYARAAFTGIINDLASVRAGKGERNDRLNRSAYNLGGLVGAGLLDEGMARSELLNAATRNGYVSKRGESAVLRIIDSAITNGKLKPRTRVGA